jgi:hypothetical protein
MISAQQQRALRIIHDGLQKTEVVWAITGSLGFALHGMKLKVNDIDLQTDASGAYEIENTFAEKVVRMVKFSVSDKIASHWGELKIEGVKVEIMGAIQKKHPNGTWESPVEVAKYREFIPFERMKLPVLSLKYEEQAYRKLGRIEKADMIKEWLTNYD